MSAGVSHDKCAAASKILIENPLTSEGGTVTPTIKTLYEYAQEDGTTDGWLNLTLKS